MSSLLTIEQKLPQTGISSKIEEYKHNRAALASDSKNSILSYDTAENERMHGVISQFTADCDELLALLTSIPSLKEPSELRGVCGALYRLLPRDRFSERGLDNFKCLTVQMRDSLNDIVNLLLDC